MGNRNASVKFFLKAKKVVASVTIDDRPSWRVDETSAVASAKVCIGGRGYKVEEVKSKKKKLGSKTNFVVLTLVFRYADYDASIECKQVDADIIGVTANLKVTITNAPPGGVGGEVIEIEETDENAEEHAGEDPDEPA